jgi:hypothetical protein
MDEICALLAPDGLIVWLRENSPFFYRRLTRDLPNEISRAWNDRVPFEDFDALCSDLVDTHRCAVELMTTSRR